MERQLRVRILTWRVLRVASGRGGPLLLLLTGLLVVGAVVLPRLDLASRTFASACMPYTVRLPRAWRAQPVPLADCGSPVLFDEYRLHLQGEQLTLSVQAVSLANGRYPNAGSLPQAGGGVRRRGGDGLVYIAYLEQDNGVMTANAAFNQPPLNYQVTVQGDGSVDPEQALTTVMDGWGPALAGHPGRVSAPRSIGQ